MSPCNLYAATGTDTGVLRLWSLPDWRQVGKPMSYDAEVSAVTFSTDSKLLAAAASDGVLRLWHAATQTPIGSKVSHGDAVSSVRFAPDGASFYTASRDYHLRRVQLCLPWQGDAKAVLRRAELVAGLGFDTDEAIAPLTEEQHWERAGSTPYAQWSATANLAIPRKVDAADVFRLEIEALRAELARRTKDAEPPDEGATQAYRSQLAESEAKFYHVVRDYRARDDVLQHHPEAAIAVGHLLLADQAWEPAIALYTRLKEIQNNQGNQDLLITEILLREAESTIN